MELLDEFTFDGMAREFRIILKGPPYSEPRYYGTLQWNDRNVYIWHPSGRKDSRHSDGATFQVGRELVNFISLKPP